MKLLYSHTEIQIVSHQKFIQDHFQLVLQQLELDIGIKAVSFFNAADSEWSYTVHMERFVRNQVKWDHSNYEIISRLKME